MRLLAHRATSNFNRFSEPWPSAMFVKEDGARQAVIERKSQSAFWRYYGAPSIFLPDSAQPATPSSETRASGQDADGELRHKYLKLLYKLCN